MNILVTGGNGMVASCIKDLQNMYPNDSFFYMTRNQCDLSSDKSVNDFFNNSTIKYDYIIHLAAKVGGLFMNLNSNIEMFSENIRINENILKACHKYNIKRGIFCLSSCIYPCNPSRFPMDETMIHESPPHPSNEGYAYAKRMLELQCRQYNKAYGTQYICVVPVNLYGPYDNFNIENGHVIPSIMHRFHKEKTKDTREFIAYGTGNPLRQFLYAPDFAKIICNILFDKNSQNIKPIICCNKEVTIKEMVETLGKTMNINVDDIKWDETKSDGCMKKTVDNTQLLKLYPDFNFISLQNGLQITYKWFTNNYASCRK